MRCFFPALLALSAIPGLAWAQETRPLPEDHTPPPASIGDAQWLTGQWLGDGIGGHPAMESWLPAVGGTMVGTFVQATADGGIQFTEHLYLMEEAGSLVLRLKHFNADLTGWEERDDMLTFTLVAIEPCAAYFGGLTLRCDGDDGLVAAVRMRNRDESLSELVFRFERLATPVAPARCGAEETTIALTQCLAALLNQAERQRQQYQAAALARREDNAELTRLLTATDDDFATYRNAECQGVAAKYGEGSMRNPAFLTCLIDMTDQRTHRIWDSWLTYGDSTPPDLPEPVPTR